jgi:hypothetical protein
MHQRKDVKVVVEGGKIPEGELSEGFESVVM